MLQSLLVSVNVRITSLVVCVLSVNLVIMISNHHMLLVVFLVTVTSKELSMVAQHVTSQVVSADAKRM